MAKQHDKQFKLDAVQYYENHKDLGVRGCAENLGIGYSTWLIVNDRLLSAYHITKKSA